MDISTLKEGIYSQAAKIAPIKGSIKLVLGNDIIYLDGTGESNIVSDEDKDADCTITTSIDTIQKMQSGKLNPMMAVMTQKVKIKGDMGLATKLQSLLG